MNIERHHCCGCLTAMWLSPDDSRRGLGSAVPQARRPFWRRIVRNDPPKLPTMTLPSLRGGWAWRRCAACDDCSTSVVDVAIMYGTLCEWRRAALRPCEWIFAGVDSRRARLEPLNVTWRPNLIEIAAKSSSSTTAYMTSTMPAANANRRSRLWEGGEAICLLHAGGHARNRGTGARRPACRRNSR